MRQNHPKRRHSALYIDTGAYQGLWLHSVSTSYGTHISMLTGSETDICVADTIQSIERQVDELVTYALPFFDGMDEARQWLTGKIETRLSQRA